ncbi:MAG: deoxyguanosinetriphosphate triphosphohydrolase [Deltaproteobacteria bacterium]|nr:deoxyguanosinetriphosphate triphosphohydrolase [Deltaproteobacteria bacterium]MBW2395324.1 deoxyguanosinetriphosphate triphosphohydrolase [Deltaproteobacteria bacterium]
MSPPTSLFATPLVATRQDREAEERERLAPFAQLSGDSRGRLHPESEHPHRTAFARDRDRIVHSRAFRRLEYKTQVFVFHEGDHERNRLTHTLEGSQIARTVARGLRLHEDLAEAVVLAHDLGHTPFGHAGEKVLNGWMQQDGGFDHNRQTMRVVDWLEDRYPSFRGLNLTHETREGLAKHGCEWEHPVAVPELQRSPSLEAQIADQSDEIAYLNHDLDDGLRSGLLTPGQLEEVALWAESRGQVEAAYGKLEAPVLRAQAIVALINRLVTDLLGTSAARLAEHAPATVDDVRKAPRLIGFSLELEGLKGNLKEFLSVHMYNHPEVVGRSRMADEVIGGLVQAYRADPGRLPAHVVARFPEEGEARAIADYIAGMTDRFALAEHEKLLESR